MLASPIYPAQPPQFSPKGVMDQPISYRPAKDLDAFNNLLPPAVEFVQGTVSTSVAPPLYEPINATPPEDSSPEASTSTSPAVNGKNFVALDASLFKGTIETVWPSSYGNESAGLYNQGNTCFLNSALQVLLHTPPLLHMLLEHTECPLAGRFCMICSLRAVSLRSSRGNKPFSPNAIVSKLQAIAKHMRPGRQEDSHEFLRYAIDALQKSCLARYSPKMDAKLAETTWVHRIFGGQLRSRVKCQECGHSSDTFDSILDLSLDIYKVQDVKAALRKFVTPDYLKGTDKYKCEKCKKPVVAEKRFSVHQAPTVLTVHLKRFSPYGGKDGHPISYDESLLLQPFMSPGQHGPRYTLYGVICHAGGGPNSGHYYAYVRGKSGQWFEMNDETVSRHSTPLRIKSAYMLFYLRNDASQDVPAGKREHPAVVSASPLTNGASSVLMNGDVSLCKVKAGMKRKERDDMDEVKPRFIGPLLPSQDEQCKRQRTKTNMSEKAAGITGLDGYGSDSSSLGVEDEAEDSQVASVSTPVAENHNAPSTSKSPPDSTIHLDSPPPSERRMPLPPKPGPIPASSFYAGAPKRKPFERRRSFDLGDSSNWKHKNGRFNPFNRMTYGKRRGRARGF